METHMRINNHEKNLKFEITDVTNKDLTRSCAVFVYEDGLVQYHISNVKDFFDYRNEAELVGIWRIKN